MKRPLCGELFWPIVLPGIFPTPPTTEIPSGGGAAVMRACGGAAQSTARCGGRAKGRGILKRHCQTFGKAR